MAEITDFEGVKAWLEGQEHLPSICCAARAALRGLPGFINAKGAVRTDFAIVIMRALLVPIVAGKFPRENLERQANSASYQASPFSTPEFGDSGICIVRSARALKNAVFSSRYPTTAAAECTKLAADAVATSGHHRLSNSAERSARSSSYSAFSADANRLESTQSPLDVFDIGLWPGQEMPEGLAENLQSLRRFWQSAPAVWDYWEQWYDGFLSGSPIDWGVQFAVASLPDEDWEKGPELIAGKINEIEQQSAKVL